jgi:hypothetical protein
MIITKLEYLRRFTAQERVTIRAAAKENPVLEDYLALMELAEEIETGDPDTIGAVNMLEQVGLIGAGRAAEILAEPTAPSAPDYQPFVATHTVQDFGSAMVEADGTVRLADGRWSTLEALAVMNKTVGAI